MSITLSPTGAFVGRDTVVEFAIVPPDTTPTDLDWKILGCTRSKAINLQWDEVDTTSSCTEGNIRESLVTYKNETFSFDGVSSADETKNQEALYLHIRNPDGGQPTGWMRFSDPRSSTEMLVLEAPALFTQFNKTRNYDAEATFSLEGRLIGSGTVTEVVVGGATVP
jgi:predicted secreted protein